MAIIRKINFGQPSTCAGVSRDLIDTPDKLLNFAQSQKLSIEPLDAKAIAKKMGIIIEYVSLDENLSGILYFDEIESVWKIQVNDKHHPNRQRYTIAHELGHFCLHRYYRKVFKDNIFFRGAETNKEEWQANEFASAILIPEKEFREKVRSGINEIKQLAEIFQVSTLALRIRAKNLGMSGHGL